MSLRYATIQNLQASGEAEPESGVETVDGLGAGSQRKAYQDTNVAFSHNKNLGVANTERLGGLFPKANINLTDYDPKQDMIDTIDSNKDLTQNPDYSTGITLNFLKDNPERDFKLTDTVSSSNVKDKPQHGVPNVKVTPADLIDPNNERTPTESPRRLGGFGTEYQINDMNQNIIQRIKIGTYLNQGKPIHDGGSTNKLGKSVDPGDPYKPLNRSAEE